MTSRKQSGFKKPRTRAQFLAEIIPTYKGSKKDLREYSLERLRAVYKTELLWGVVRLVRR